MNTEKIGVFGGTFNPVHKGHEMTAVSFYNKFRLNKLIIMPSNIPPHKQIDSDVSAVQRFEMCVIAFGKYKYNISVSDFEIKKEGLSYTFDTVTALKKMHKNVKLYFLVGSDMFLYLENWRRYRDLLEMCAFAVAFRNDDNEDKRRVTELRDKLMKTGAEIEILENEPFEISSTELRERIKNITDNNFDLERYMSKEVLAYIRERNIYAE